LASCRQKCSRFRQVHAGMFDTVVAEARHETVNELLAQARALPYAAHSIQHLVGCWHPCGTLFLVLYSVVEKERARRRSSPETVQTATKSPWALGDVELCFINTTISDLSSACATIGLLRQSRRYDARLVGFRSH